MFKNLDNLIKNREKILEGLSLLIDVSNTPFSKEAGIQQSFDRVFPLMFKVDFQDEGKFQNSMNTAKWSAIHRLKDAEKIVQENVYNSEFPFNGLSLKTIKDFIEYLKEIPEKEGDKGLLSYLSDLYGVSDINSTHGKETIKKVIALLNSIFTWFLDHRDLTTGFFIGEDNPNAKSFADNVLWAMSELLEESIKHS